jgi:anti-sigma regulatory factor (Ser/Thr protein kinase)
MPMPISDSTPHQSARGSGDRVTIAVDIEADPTSVREARDAVTELLERNGCDDRLLESVRLVVSELVTNAVVHAGTHIGLRCRLDVEACRVRIEVTDMRPEAQPVMRRSDALGEGGGWGLQFVSTLGTNWGVATSEHQKTVWCDVVRPDDQQASAT